jgi:phasin family protein
MATPQEQFLDLYRTSLEGMVSLTRATLDEAERLRTRQLQSIREALDENAALSREIAGAQTPEDLFNAQTKFANHQFEVALGYWGKLLEAANHTQLEAMKRVEQHSSLFQERLGTMLDSAPPGSEPMVAAMKSFLQAARAAYGIGAQATQQAAKLTEAQFVTATAGIRDAVAQARKKSA